MPVAERGYFILPKGKWDISSLVQNRSRSLHIWPVPGIHRSSGKSWWERTIYSSVSSAYFNNSSTGSVDVFCWWLKWYICCLLRGNFAMFSALDGPLASFRMLSLTVREGSFATRSFIVFNRLFSQGKNGLLWTDEPWLWTSNSTVSSPVVIWYWRRQVLLTMSPFLSRSKNFELHSPAWFFLELNLRWYRSFCWISWHVFGMTVQVSTFKEVFFWISTVHVHVLRMRG